MPQKNTKKNGSRKVVLALPDADENLKGSEVISHWSMVPEIAKKIE